MATVFISYSRESKERVRVLAQDLVDLGQNAWFDQQLTGGQAWWDLILSEIRKCDVFAYALAPDSLSSPICKLECAYASKLGKPILPVLIADGVSSDLLPSVLAEIQYVDYRRDDKEALKALAKALAALPNNDSMPDPLPDPPSPPVSRLAALRDQVDASEELSLSEQSTLLLLLQDAIRQAKNPEDVYTVLRTFRLRDDLKAKIAVEIDSILDGLDSPPMAPKPSKEKRVPVEKQESGYSEKIEEILEFALSILAKNRRVWLALAGGFVIDAVLRGIEVSKPVFSLTLSSWSLPAAILLCIAVIWNEMRFRHTYFKLLFISLIIAGSGLIFTFGRPDLSGFSRIVWQIRFLIILIPFSAIAAASKIERHIRRSKVKDRIFLFSARPVSDRVAWTYLVAGFLCSALVSRLGSMTLVHSAELVVAVGFLIFTLLMLTAFFLGAVAIISDS